jgi:hypothetical protein
LLLLAAELEKVVAV